MAPCCWFARVGVLIPKRFLRAVATTSGYTVLSRLGGFLRETLAATYLGAGVGADAFVLATRLPAFFRAMCSEGAFHSCFVPLFSKNFFTVSAEEATRFAGKVLVVLLCFVITLTSVTEVFLPQILKNVFPQLLAKPDLFERLVPLARVCFPFVVFISLTALYGGILNALGYFSPAACSPAISNLLMIIFIVVGVHYFSSPEQAFAWGFLGSGVAGFIWVWWPAYKKGLGLRPTRPELSLDVKAFFSALGPVVVGSGVNQFSLYIGVFLVSWLPTGSVAHLNYADRLNQLPVGVIGVAIGTVLLPFLSRKLHCGDRQLAHSYQELGLTLGLLATIPVAILFYLLSESLISILFEHGAFCAIDTQKTAQALSIYAWGLPPYIVIKILSTRFFAISQTKPPFITAAVGVAVGLLCSLFFIQKWGHLAIPLGATVAVWVNSGLLMLFLSRSQGPACLSFLKTCPAFLSAGCAMVLAVSAGAIGFHSWLQSERLYKFIGVALLSLWGVFIFFICVTLLAFQKVRTLFNILRTLPSDSF